MNNQENRYSRKVNNKKTNQLSENKKQISKKTKLIILISLFFISILCIIGVVLLIANIKFNK